MVRGRDRRQKYPSIGGIVGKDYYPAVFGWVITELTFRYRLMLSLEKTRTHYAFSGDFVLYFFSTTCQVSKTALATTEAIKP